MVTLNKESFFKVGNIIIPLIIMVVLGILSSGKGDYREIFEPTGLESLIDPIDFAFAIWGPIFLFLIIYLGYQARDVFKSAEKKEQMDFVNQVNVYFILSTLMAGIWYISWLNRVVWLATVSMIIYLVFLLVAYLRLEINLTERSKKEMITIVIPWSMYTGWITAATIISITTFFVSIGFNDPPGIVSDAIWAMIVLLIAVIIYISVLIIRNDYVFTLVGLWAVLGILFNNLTASPIVLEVILTCVIGISLIPVAMVFQFYRNKKT